MSPDEQYIRPPSLRAYLDGGGDLSGFALLDSLVEAVVVARRLLPADTNRKQAARNRRFVERWFARHGGEVPVPALGCAKAAVERLCRASPKRPSALSALH